MKVHGQQLLTAISHIAPYPAAIQVLISLVLLATPLSALDMTGNLLASASGRDFRLLMALLGVHLVLLWIVPVRRLPAWAVVVYLAAQCGLTATAQAVLPIPLIDYVYLTIVIQAITVSRLWLWIPLAIGVWLVWSGTLIITLEGLSGWLQSNLSLAFPTVCVIIAAVIYARQQRRHEQVQQLLAQVQQRYAEMVRAARDMQQRFAMEERSRLAQTVASEVQIVLSHAEQSMAQTISQGQSNLSRMQLMVAQTRDAASMAVERLRNTIATLRRNEYEVVPQAVWPGVAPGTYDESILSSLSTRLLNWILPLVFVTLAALLTLFQHHFSLESLGPVIVFGTALMALAICTQWVQHPFWLHAGFAGQAIAVTAMALLTQTLPLLLGLLLVIWQIVFRLSNVHLALVLIGLPASLWLLISRVMPLSLTPTDLMVFGVAFLIAGGPLYLARRQFMRRQAIERQLAELSNEIERQTQGSRILAVTAERARLAREFHDDLGNKLVLINLQLQLAEDLAAEQPDAALEELEKSREQLRQAWRSVLAAADAALPIEGTALESSLHELIGQCRHSTSVIVDLLIDGDLSGMPPAMASTVYRTVQEGLTNACKHARPQHIAVQVTADENLVTVTVSDDGHGHAPGTMQSLAMSADQGGHFGLAGLRERAELLSGGFEAGPLSSGGFRVRMILPADEDQP